MSEGWYFLDANQLYGLQRGGFLQLVVVSVCGAGGGGGWSRPRVVVQVWVWFGVQAELIHAAESSFSQQAHAVQPHGREEPPQGEFGSTLPLFCIRPRSEKQGYFSVFFLF